MLLRGHRHISLSCEARTQGRGLCILSRPLLSGAGSTQKQQHVPDDYGMGRWKGIRRGIGSVACSALGGPGASPPGAPAPPPRKGPSRNNSPWGKVCGSETSCPQTLGHTTPSCAYHVTTCRLALPRRKGPHPYQAAITSMHAVNVLLPSK